MELSLTTDTTKGMAKRLREALGCSQFSHAQCLELLAHTLGHPNWDTLSGLLKQDDGARRFRLERPVTLYMDVFCCDEYGEGPGWAKMIVDQAFIDRILHMQDQCRREKLSFVAVDWGVEAWERDDEHRMRGEALHVHRDWWYVRAHPKHMDYSCETRLVTIDALLGALQRGAGSVDRTGAGSLAWYKDVLISDGQGNTRGLVEQLIEGGQLDESYASE